MQGNVDMLRSADFRAVLQKRANRNHRSKQFSSSQTQPPKCGPTAAVYSSSCSLGSWSRPQQYSGHRASNGFIYVVCSSMPPTTDLSAPTHTPLLQSNAWSSIDNIVASQAGTSTPKRISAGGTHVMCARCCCTVVEKIGPVDERLL